MAVLLTGILTVYHRGTGTPFGSAFRMTTDDYRLVMTCPRDTETILDFVLRSPPAEDSPPMPVQYGDDWARRLCDGEIALTEEFGSVWSPQSEADRFKGSASTAMATSTPPRPGVAAGPPTGSERTASPTPVAPSAVTGTDTPASTPLVPVPPPDLPNVTPTGTPTSPIPPPNLRFVEQKRFMLELINAERSAVGLSPVVLGDNVAAQLHVEASLENCSVSHWGMDGLKPYMRYSLAGGYQTNGENVSGIDYCIKRSDRYQPLGSIEREIRETMEGWMDSPGHRRTILDPSYRNVNIGLAWDSYNLMANQHFEGDYVEYDRLPAIKNGVLTITGVSKNGVVFADGEDLGVQIYYDPPPHALTRGQVSRTYCYDSGRLVAALRPSLPPDWFYPEDEFTERYRACPDPYDVPADALAPRSPDEAHEFWRAAYRASQTLVSRPISVPWITAREWIAGGEFFSVTVDLRHVLAEHGPGVYSLIVWGRTGGEDTPISEYSLFHDAVPPNTYTAE